MNYLKLIMYDHAKNDWREVIKGKIHVPTAIFSGENSPWLASQKWMNSVIKDSTFFLIKKVSPGTIFFI